MPVDYEFVVEIRGGRRKRYIVPLRPAKGRGAMKRAKTQRASGKAPTLGEALELVERRYREGKLELMTAEELRALRDQTIANAGARQKRMSEKRSAKQQKALS